MRKRITVPETLSDITIGQYLELVSLPDGQEPAEQMADTLRIACGI